MFKCRTKLLFALPLCLIGLQSAQASELPAASGLQVQVSSAQNATQLIQATLQQRSIGLLNIRLDWQSLSQIYANRNHQPIWHQEGSPTTDSVWLIEKISSANDEGMKTARYHRRIIDSMFGQSDATRLIWTDILLTNALIQYSRDMILGQLDPALLDANWYITQDKFNPVNNVEEILNSHSISDALDKLSPRASDYVRLRSALQQYRSIANNGGWFSIPAGDTLRLGDQNLRVALLRDNLTAQGDYAKEDNNQPDYFDSTLASAVTRFQSRHGLDTDGIVGSGTIDALNVPVETRIAQLKANMERWRWMPNNLGSRYILTNSAGFDMKLVENGEVQLHENTITGRPKRSTPSFNSAITQLVVNPSWTVPKRLAVEDLLPKQKKDAGYLARKNISVLKRVDGKWNYMDPEVIDWSLYNRNNFPFTFRQAPGKKNSLGQIKFYLPNKYAIFLHDTPSKGLFKKTNRAFSSGCIRVEDAPRLASTLLENDTQWSTETLNQVLDSGITQYHSLSVSVPVYLSYFTSWVEENGTINFRPDIYKRNRLIQQAQMPEIPGNTFLAQTQTTTPTAN